MRRTAWLTIAAALAFGPAAHADPAVDKVVKTFGDAFNAGNVALAKAQHVPAPVIVDEVAPFMWSGQQAFDTWLGDLAKSEAAEGRTGGRVTIGAPTREVIAGSHAYIVSPSSYTFMQKGVRMRETAQITFTLYKADDGWKISSWTWTGPEAKPAP